MSEMIERVARAIYDAENGIDGDQIGDMICEDFRITGVTAEDCRRQTMDVCRYAARAIEAALAEAGYVIVPLKPTEAMIAAGAEALMADPLDPTPTLALILAEQTIAAALGLNPPETPRP